MMCDHESCDAGFALLALRPPHAHGHQLGNVTNRAQACTPITAGALRLARPSREPAFWVRVSTIMCDMVVLL